MAFRSVALMLMLVLGVDALRVTKSSQKAKQAFLTVTSSKKCDVGSTTLWGAKKLLSQIISRHASAHDPLAMPDKVIERADGVSQCAGPVKAVVRSSLHGLTKAKVSSMKCLESKCLKKTWMGCKRYHLELEVELDLGDTLQVRSQADVSCGDQAKFKSTALTLDVLKTTGKALAALEFQYVPPDASTPKFKELSLSWPSQKSQCKFSDNSELEGFICGDLLSAKSTHINDGIQKVIDAAIKDPLGWK